MVDKNTVADTVPEVMASEARALALGRHGNPFAVLGPGGDKKSPWITVYAPHAARVWAIVDGSEYPLSPSDGESSVFRGAVPGTDTYTLRAESTEGHSWEWDDPYRFGPVFGELDEHLLGEGTHQRLWTVLGAHLIEHEGARGCHFAVWAPNAVRVSVVADFNGWDGRVHVMRKRGSTGVWEIFIPGVTDGTAYKYEILGPGDQLMPLKADPVGFGAQHPPETASMVRDISGFGWKDAEWMETRADANGRNAAMSIYEVHLGSWRRRLEDDNRPLSYKEAAVELVDYVAEMGFTHIEFLPLSEFPFDGSWGYQPIGLFAPTIRHGPPHEFRDLVEAAHQRGIGVILDWVPGHFPTDEHGLGRFDGTPLYEHADPREGFHQDWNTLIYNYGRTEVANFLISNALYWMEEYHVDGLRVDAVASMLYRDYSRDEGQWIPNKDGGRENYEAISLLQRMNTTVYGEVPGVMTAAEESTSFPGVSQPVDSGGLGFGYKWNMGWMNDTLDYMARDPVHRRHHHNQMTFGMAYAFSENFILPISHDEVVHGKGSMLAKMPGNITDKFANLRAYYAFMWGHPGKKLLFMGCEFAQKTEWNHNSQLDWAASEQPEHAGMQRLVRDLNTLYRGLPAMHVNDCQPDGFRWIEADDADRSVYAWVRYGEDGDAPVAVICNMTPVARDDYVIGLPESGQWNEVLNTDAAIYGGGDRGNMGGIEATPQESHGQPAKAKLYLPPLSCVMLVHESRIDRLGEET